MENDLTKLQMQDLERRVRMLEEMANTMLWKPFPEDLNEKMDDMVKQFGEFLTKTQAAQILSVTRPTVYTMLADGRLKGACSGSKVSTRSIAHYLFSPEKKTRKKKHEDHA